MHNNTLFTLFILHILTYYDFYDFLRILIFLKIWIVIKKLMVDVGNILFI